MAFFAELAQGYDQLVDATLPVMFNEVVGLVSVVAGRRADSKALQFFDGGSYVGTMGQETSLGDVGHAQGFALHVTAFASGYVTLLSWYSDPAIGPPAGTPGPFTRLFSLRLYADGSLAFYKGATLIGGTAAGVFTFGAWQYVELSFVVTQSGVWTDGYNAIRVNGTTAWWDIPTDNNESASTRLASYVRYGHLDAGTASPDPIVLWDDFYIIRHATDANQEAPFLTDEHPGLASTSLDVRIGAIVPNGAGAFTQWTPSAGANWETVDDPLSTGADGDATYVEGQSVIDTYAWEPFAPQGIGSLASVQFVTHWYAGRLTAANTDGARLQHYYRYTDDASNVTNGVQTTGGGSGFWTATTSYRYWPNSQRRTPANEAWTVTRMGRMQWGASVGVGATNRRATHHTVEAVWLARRARQRSRAYLLA